LLEPNLAYLCLGSNLQPELYLPMAAARLSELGQVCAASRVYQSRPMGRLDQPDFLNAAVLLRTSLSAAALRQALRQIEARLGRIRGHDRNAPRTIDIDLSLFNHEVLTVGRRRIPDPDLLTRAFVAVPVAELDPDYCHPLTGEPLRAIAARLAQTTALHVRDDVQLLATAG
jgi:2-amino-4-hydroxy-6-hydroxymethyldihydropteridine diphosphokinase